MAAQDLLTLNRMRQRNLFSMEWPTDDGGIYPEQRLWVAVIVHAISEYEEKLQHMKKLVRAGKTLPHFMLMMIQTIRYEMRHEWFERVCELANVDHIDVVNRIKALDREYGLAEMKFTDDADVRPTDIAAVKKRFQHG